MSRTSLSTRRILATVSIGALLASFANACASGGESDSSTGGSSGSAGGDGSAGSSASGGSGGVGATGGSGGATGGTGGSVGGSAGATGGSAGEAGDGGLEDAGDGSPDGSAGASGTAGSGGSGGSGGCGSQPELCNGLDDNCNNQIDENNPGGGGDCTVPNKTGECAFGTNQCLTGFLQCVQKNQPTVEICDGKDNDCNGAVDQGNPGGGQSCATGQLGICAAGTTSCSGGTLNCVPNVPTPQTEICNGLDDNCNGQTDENNPGGGQTCDTGKLGVCAAGTTNCDTGVGQLKCVQSVQAGGESCNNKDDDCNGTIDDPLVVDNIPCQTGQSGVCAAGLTKCTAGVSQCNQTTQSSSEKCNGLDDNCDGTTDNGNATTMCITQYPSAGNVATWACTGGNCEIAACNAGFKNTNGSPADGCEATTCVTSPSPSTCSSPTASPGLSSGNPSYTFTGQLTVNGQEAWWAPSFSAPNPATGPTFVPTIQLTLNQGGDYQLDVMYGCAGPFAACPAAGAHSGSGSGQNITDKWQMNFNANPSTCGIAGVGACTNLSSVPANIKVVVKRIKVTDPCNQFSVKFSQ